MRSIFQGSAVIAASLFATSFAIAADLGARPVYKAAAPQVVTAYNWSGCHVGGNVGYGWARASGEVTALGVTASASENLNGIVYGGQVGCDLQTGNWVWGIETDFQGTGQKHTDTLVTPGFAVSVTDRIPWFGTVRGRAGVAADNWLFYVTGGYGYGKFTSSATFSGQVAGTLDTSNTHGAWVIGGGIENAIDANWSWKLEYLYLNTGNITSNSTVLGTPITTTSKVSDNIVRVGLNYRFGTGKGPVVAGY